MTTPRQADPDEALDARDELVHLWCCDNNMSICGLDITDETHMPDAAEDQYCEICDNKDRLNVPCGHPDCPAGRP